MNTSSLHATNHTEFVSNRQSTDNHEQLKKVGSSLEVCLENASKSNNIKLTNSHRIYHAKESLFYAGEQFVGLYILRSGSAKSFITSIDGEEHITKFYYPGDLLGVDGFDENKHMESVFFLETSSVCLVKEADLNNLVKDSDDFRSCLFRAISHALVSDSAMMMCLSSSSSEKKVARFVIEVSEQYLGLGLSATEFRLSMTRTDIANYLGMAIETVSRVLTIFQDRKLLHIQNRQVKILNYSALIALIAKDSCKTASPQSAAKVNKCIGSVY